MDQFKEKEVIQAILVADSNEDHFRPITQNISKALLPLVNVPVLDYSLETLNRSGVEDVFVYAGRCISDVRAHIKKGIDSKCSWSLNMKVIVIGSEGSRSLGDALRDLDAKGLIRGHFIIMGADSVTNADLTGILQEHKKTAKFDRGASMTVVYKEAKNTCRVGDEVMIGFDRNSRRLHFHQRLKQNVKEPNFKIPLEIFLNNSKLTLHHNIIDPQIAIGSPSMLSLFSDNFDFESRDDFIKGLLINEEILDSRIYVSFLPMEQYGRKLSNWLAYQIVSADVINRYVYPLVPDMGISNLCRKYVFLRNNIYKSLSASISQAILKQNVVVGDKTSIGSGTLLSSTVVGNSCKIGKNCVLENVFVFDGAVIEDNCNLEYCVIGRGSQVGTGSKLFDGVVLGENVILPTNTKLANALLQSTCSDEDNINMKLSKAAFLIDENEEVTASDSEDEEVETNKYGIPKMAKIPFKCDYSDYDSSTEGAESKIVSPALDDSHIFLSEVVDSLERGFQDKSDPNFLILEINSSRYAYNMTLEEVNFYVVKAIFSLSEFKNSERSIVTILHQVLSHLGPVMKNYIKTEDSMRDCLKALEDCFDEESMNGSSVQQIVHYLYDKEYVSEEAILTWYNGLLTESSDLRESLSKLINWLMESSESEDE